MKSSEELSEQKNERDRKYYKQTFNSLIERFGNMFKPPILTEEELEKDVDCLALVESLIPELSVENVSHFARILSKDQGFNTNIPLVNAILRKFHRVRYVN